MNLKLVGNGAFRYIFILLDALQNCMFSDFNVQFQKADESTSMRHYRLAYAGLYDMGMEARRLKNLRSVNGTVFLLDSTLHRYHDPATNSHLQESETVSTFD